MHYKIPLLFVLANNRSFYNDELHQERMARARNRPVENKWIGQRMSDPEVDLAAMGRAQGAVGFGPVTKPGDLPAFWKRPSPQSMPARSPSSMCASSPAIRRS